MPVIPKEVPKAAPSTNPEEVNKILDGRTRAAREAREQERIAAETARDLANGESVDLPDQAEREENAQEAAERLRRQVDILAAEVEHTQRVEQEKRDKPWSNFYAGSQQAQRHEKWLDRLKEIVTVKDEFGNEEKMTYAQQLESKNMLILNRHQRRDPHRYGVENDTAKYESSLPRL